MNKLILATLVAMPILVGGCQSSSIVYIYAPNIPDSVITPSKVYTINRGEHWKKPTHGLMETSEGIVLAMGPIALIKRGKNESYYRIGNCDSAFALPNSDFSMEGKFLRDRWKNKVEVAIVEPEPSECEDDGGIKFDHDSVARSMRPPQRKVLSLELSEVSWLGDTTMLVPRISAARIDSIDLNANAVYSLAIEVNGRVVCKPMPIDREIVEGLVKDIVYQPSLKNYGLEFRNGNKGYTYRGEQIARFYVITDYKAPGKTKKMPHYKRDRKKVKTVVRKF